MEAAAVSRCSWICSCRESRSRHEWSKSIWVGNKLSGSYWVQCHDVYLKLLNYFRLCCNFVTKIRQLQPWFCIVWFKSSSMWLKWFAHARDKINNSHHNCTHTCTCTKRYYNSTNLVLDSISFSNCEHFCSIQETLVVHSDASVSHSFRCSWTTIIWSLIHVHVHDQYQVLNEHTWSVIYMYAWLPCLLQFLFQWLFLLF